jgi:hypothetical protein
LLPQLLFVTQLLEHLSDCHLPYLWLSPFFLLCILLLRPKPHEISHFRGFFVHLLYDAPAIAFSCFFHYLQLLGVGSKVNKGLTSVDGRIFIGMFFLSFFVA